MRISSRLELMGTDLENWFANLEEFHTCLDQYTIKQCHEYSPSQVTLLSIYSGQESYHEAREHMDALLNQHDHRDSISIVPLRAIRRTAVHTSSIEIFRMQFSSPRSQDG